MRRHFPLILLSFCCFFFTISAAEPAGYGVPLLPPAPSPRWEQVVDFAQQTLPLEGQLVAKSDGYVYLKVDDRYIHLLFPLLGLKEEGFQEPPYFRRKDAPGAHISVIYAGEHIAPKELGQTFHFTLKRIILVKASKFKTYAVLQVNSPELEKLREKYGLSPKLFGHEFHISIAQKTEHFKHKTRE